jgi:hypothetical protein
MIYPFVNDGVGYFKYLRGFSVRHERSVQLDCCLSETEVIHEVGLHTGLTKKVFKSEGARTVAGL